MSDNTGGPALPFLQFDAAGKVSEQGKGMSLRDYLAAKAMHALMISDKYSGIVGINNYEHNRAKDAYKMADAMIKAR